MELSHTLETQVEIDAPPERVWEVLADLPTWGDWNPFIPLVEGQLVAGRRLRIKVVAPGLKPMEFKPEVFAVRPPEEIIWGGSFLGIVYRGDHAIFLEPLPDGRTRLRQRERFRGPLVLLMANMFPGTKQGYDQMNQALKRRVESTQPVELS